jgi:hypothetical protein
MKYEDNTVISMIPCTAPWSVEVTISGTGETWCTPVIAWALTKVHQDTDGEIRTAMEPVIADDEGDLTTLYWVRSEWGPDGCVKTRLLLDGKDPSVTIANPGDPGKEDTP